MKVFSVTDPIFKTDPLFILGCPRADLDAYLRRRFRVMAGDATQHWAGQMFTFDKVPWRVVWTLNIDLPVILHETFHLVTRICQDKGIGIVAHHPDGAYGDETAAYLFEFFARAIVRRVRR